MIRTPSLYPECSATRYTALPLPSPPALRMPRPYQGLATFGLEEIDLLRVNGDAFPILQVQQYPVVKVKHESSLRPPVDSAVKRDPGRLSGRFSG